MEGRTDNGDSGGGPDRRTAVPSFRHGGGTICRRLRRRDAVDGRSVHPVDGARGQRSCDFPRFPGRDPRAAGNAVRGLRSEEHTSALQSLMRISYAVLCLKTKKTKRNNKKQQNK